jgi:hypothetical protein
MSKNTTFLQMFSTINESGELRLFLEEVCCDLLRFEHVRRPIWPIDAI